ncbi:MAG TPA: hypothetical protein V6D28_09775 [Leptolyngbyaceae cyanobacterium]
MTRKFSGAIDTRSILDEEILRSSKHTVKTALSEKSLSYLRSSFFICGKKSPLRRVR